MPWRPSSAVTEFPLAVAAFEAAATGPEHPARTWEKLDSMLHIAALMEDILLHPQQDDASLSIIRALKIKGELIAPLCAAGAIALQVLEKRGVTIAAHLLSVADVDDVPFSSPTSGADSVGSLDAQIEGSFACSFSVYPTIPHIFNP